MQAVHDRLRRRAVIAGLCAWPLWAGAGYRDPLDTPAAKRASPGQRPLLAVTLAGSTWVGVGSRGLIVRSIDGGQQWVQSEVPVQSDLLAVHFPSATQGWAVGHDGVVLHSADGGLTWSRQLDGRSARTAFEAFYADAGEAGKVSLAQVQKNYGNGPVLPFLDVWFDDERHGVIVGSFGQVATTDDGGKTWQPALHRIDNPDGYNLNAVRGIAGQVFIAGEHGRVFQLDRASGRFRAMDTGYNGSFFGIAGSADVMLAFGLRGVVYRAEAGAPQRWSALPMTGEQTLTAGLYDPARGFVLVNAAGQLLLGGHEGLRWQVLSPARPLRAAGLGLIDPRTALLACLDGAHLTPLTTAP